MLKNRRYVKVVMAMMLSVTLLCAMCLPTYAVVPHYVSETDSAHNMYYHAEIDGSVDVPAGVVYAACASTLACRDIDNQPAGYSWVGIRTIIIMYRDGEIIARDCKMGYRNLEEDYGIEVSTDWLVPDISTPFDYVVTQHEVYLIDDLQSWATGLVSGSLLWSESLVFNYQNFLTQ